MAIDAKSLAGADPQQETVARVLEDFKDVPALEGMGAVRYPGEGMLAFRRDSLENGVPVDPGLWRRVRRCNRPRRRCAPEAGRKVAAMKISVWNEDLSERYLRQVTQLGAEYIDFGSGAWFPGVEEQGYPDLDAVIGARRKVRSYGLDINRVTLPDVGADFMAGRSEGDRDLENACDALRVFAEAGCPLARQRFAGDTFGHMMARSVTPHRGGYPGRAETLVHPSPAAPAARRWIRGGSASAWSTTPWCPSPRRPGSSSPCTRRTCPTRIPPSAASGSTASSTSTPAPAWATSTAAAPARGRRFRHRPRRDQQLRPQGPDLHGSLSQRPRSLATAGGFEEVLLDDGDMNMFRVLQALDKVGFDGCINPDHHPRLEGDDGGVVALGYAIGYIKACLAALSVVP